MRKIITNREISFSQYKIIKDVKMAWIVSWINNGFPGSCPIHAVKKTSVGDDLSTSQSVEPFLFVKGA
jgi:hypothetical protein